MGLHQATEPNLGPILWHTLRTRNSLCVCVSAMFCDFSRMALKNAKIKMCVCAAIIIYILSQVWKNFLLNNADWINRVLSVLYFLHLSVLNETLHLLFSTNCFFLDSPRYQRDNSRHVWWHRQPEASVGAGWWFQKSNWTHHGESQKRHPSHLFLTRSVTTNASSPLFLNISSLFEMHKCFQNISVFLRSFYFISTCMYLQTFLD